MSAIPVGFAPIVAVAEALGMSVAALQRAVDATGRVRALVARDGKVLVHLEEAMALGRPAC
jgi:Cu/Ag efflux protein CusF